MALVLMVSAGWGTGLFYLVARLGATSPVPLAQIDGVHVYVGLVGGLFVLAKLARVGLRRRVWGVPGLLLWQRWISWSLLILYGAILVSGVLLLLPIKGRLYGNLTEVHLLTSVWALAPTTWHVWHYRHRALPFLSRPGPGHRRLRFWAGLSLLVPAALVLLAQPRAVTQLPRVLGGASWSRAALDGRSLDTVVTAPDGSSLLAGGDALYVSHDGRAWSRVELAPPVQPAAHGYSAAPVTTIQTLAVGGGGVFAGTSSGLYFARTMGDPLTQIAFAGYDVPSVAVDPADPRSVWVAAPSGPMFSRDGGKSWSGLSAGLSTPQLATAIACFKGYVFASDLTGVFELAPGARSWRRVSSQTSVIDLTAGRDALYATSITQGIEVLAGGRWMPLAPPGPSHQHHGQGHAHSQLGGVLAFGQRLYVPGTADGVSASADGGETWTQLGGGIASVAPGQVSEFDGALWAATADGLYRYQLTPERPGSAAWWALLLAAALGCGVLATLFAVPDRVKPVRSGGDSAQID